MGDNKLLKVGDNAPQFVLQNTDGKSVYLNNFFVNAIDHRIQYH